MILLKNHRRSVGPRFARREALGLTKAEFATLSRLSTPHKIQNFLALLPQNFEQSGQTCLSVREVLRQRRAHCIEGAMLAALALWVQGEPPLLLDLTATRDFDHVVALFRRRGHWGAISKTNNAVLRYRDPVYRTLRELSMSYFHEYANGRAQKTLRTWGGPFDLRRLDPALWVTSPKSCWEVGHRLEALKHWPLVTKKQVKLLRLRDTLERKAGTLWQHRPPRRR
ncbi:MAG: hypothetical protein HYU75_02825 [Betaproteobacteria bacterium]|nr:hypothetical protein [Betaproteobacteria bacterium]